MFGASHSLTSKQISKSLGSKCHSHVKVQGAHGESVYVATSKRIQWS